MWVLRSLTKFYAIPGLRLGYLVNGDARAVARMRERQMPWSINAFAALAGKLFSRMASISENLAVAGGRGATLLPSAAPRSRSDGLSRAGQLSVLRCDVPDLDLQYVMLQRRILIPQLR